MSGQGSRTAGGPREPTCELTALRWEGDLPSSGEYLLARGGKTAYRIVSVQPGPRHARHRVRIFCERRARETLGAAAVVHRWEWVAR